MTLVMTEPCKGCKDKSCLKVCPVDCFYEDSEMVYINPDECVDCEACIPECPVEAIFYEDDVPMQWFNSRLTHPLTRETVGCKPTRARKRPP